MAHTTPFLCFLLFLSFLASTGTSQTVCPPSVLEIKETPTGRTIETKTEWKVNITNTCTCTVYQIKLLCPNFQSTVKVDPSVIAKIDGDHCFINNGFPIYGGTSFSFTYAWDRIDFAPSAYTEACS